VPEHGTMFTLALVRFPPTATKEIQYLNAKGALTYTDIAGDPVLYGNLPPREIDRKSVVRDRVELPADLGASRANEQDADVVAFSVGQEVYQPADPDPTVSE